MPMLPGLPLHARACRVCPAKHARAESAEWSPA